MHAPPDAWLGEESPDSDAACSTRPNNHAPRASHSLTPTMANSRRGLAHTSATWPVYNPWQTWQTWQTWQPWQPWPAYAGLRRLAGMDCRLRAAGCATSRFRTASGPWRVYRPHGSELLMPVLSRCPLKPDHMMCSPPPESACSTRRVGVLRAHLTCEIWHTVQLPPRAPTPSHLASTKYAIVTATATGHTRAAHER